MSERMHGEPHGGDQPRTDSEIRLKTFFAFAVGLVALTLVSLLAMWAVFGVLERQADKGDPPPSPIAEANQRRLPPAPNLQVRPEKDLAALRASENERLHGYGWVDQSQGIAHIPIERAIELVAQRAEAPVDVAPAPGTAPATTEPAAAPVPTEPPPPEGH